MPNFILIKSGIVENIIVSQDPPQLSGYVIMNASDCAEKPQKGWTYDGQVFTPPAPVAKPVAMGVLTHDCWAIPANDTDVITLTYTADEAVCFVVNDEIHVVEPLDQVATLEITADAPGPIRVEVRGEKLVLAATEVAA